MNIKVFAHASYLWCWIKLLIFDFQKLPLGHQDHNCCSCCTLSYKCFVTSNTVLASEYYLDLLCLFRVSENWAKCIHCHSSAFPPGLHTLAVVGITLLRPTFSSSLSPESITLLSAGTKLCPWEKWFLAQLSLPFHHNTYCMLWNWSYFWGVEKNNTYYEGILFKKLFFSFRAVQRMILWMLMTS